MHLSTKSFRVALAQVLSDADIDAVIDDAADAAADVVVFPEMFSNGYSKFDPLKSPALTNSTSSNDLSFVAQVLQTVP